MNADELAAAELAVVKLEDAKKAIPQSIFTWHRKLPGGASLIGIDGTLTRLSWISVVQRMIVLFPLTCQDKIWDAGAGSGVCVLMLALLLAPPLANSMPRIRSFEICETKMQRAESLMQLVMGAGLVHPNEFVRQVMEARSSGGCLPIYYHASVASLGPIHATVVVAFWEGWAPADKIRLGQVFAGVRHAVIIQRRCNPQSMLEKCAWPAMQCMDELPVSMHGSGQKYVAYFFKNV